jgi:hypothetical protein
VSDDPDRRVGRLLATYGLPFASSALTIALCLGVSARNAERGRAARTDLQRTQCALIVSLDDNYRDSVLTTDIARRNAATMAQLRTSLGCDPRS